MSRTTLHGFTKDGDIYNIEEYGNAHLFCVLVWIEMGKKYGIKDPSMFLLDEAKAKEIWALAKGKDVPTHDRITMMTTFDRCMVLAKDFDRVAAALKESSKWLPPHCHTNKMAEDIEKLDKDKVYAIGWNGTSVVRVWDTEEWKDDDDYVPYNLFKHNKHFNLFEHLVENSIEEISSGKG